MIPKVGFFFFMQDIFKFFLFWFWCEIWAGHDIHQYDALYSDHCSLWIIRLKNIVHCFIPEPSSSESQDFWLRIKAFCYERGGKLQSIIRYETEKGCYPCDLQLTETHSHKLHNDHIIGVIKLCFCSPSKLVREIYQT